MKVEGYTIKELSEALKITPVTVRQRLHIAGITPLTKEAIYPKNTLDKIKDVPSPGRPSRKDKKE
jgi:hypothetical protein